MTRKKILEFSKNAFRVKYNLLVKYAKWNYIIKMNMVKYNSPKINVADLQTRVKKK